MFRKRIIALFLVVAILASFVVSVSAAPSSVVDTNTVEQWNLWIENNFVFEYPVIGNQVAFWRVVDSCFQVSGIDALDSRAALQQRASNWNNHMNYSRECWPSLVAYMVMTASEKGPWAVIGYDSNLGVYRLYDQTTGLWLVDSGGRFPYYCETSTGDIEASTRQDQWLPIVTAAASTKVAVLSKDSLSDLCVTVNQTDRTCSMRDTYINDQRFYVIIDTSNNIYANADKVPYVAHYDATATDVKYDYIVGGDTIDNSTTIDNSQVIDQSNGVFNYIDTQNNTTEEFYIDELLYDFSSQSYSADTYNITYDNDTYYTYNYTWNITYNITNTYVTNIGQTELYQPLELYYQLPDGRSSADLTAEEVASMSFEFADCVNYAKSATDTYLRALYHFDGNTDDSSYFSTQGKFEWVKGASISYMDVGTFDGALYLGPEAHQFKITLPSNLAANDFSVQFRYYQEGAADTATNIENSVSIGGVTVMQWDESSIYAGTSTTSCSALSIGTWSELALIKHSNKMYLYLNGLCISSFADTNSYAGTVTITLGDTSRASSMIDELRVVNFAVAESGASYTCTSVPYDTNAILVLPDSAFPIADEYWSIESSYSNKFGYSKDAFLDGVIGSTEYNSGKKLSYNSTYSSVAAYIGYTRLTTLKSAATYAGAPGSGFYKLLGTFDSYYGEWYDSSWLDVTTTYCCSVVLVDGTICSLSFLPGRSSTATFDWGTISSVLISSGSGDNAYLVITPNDYVDVLYIELAETEETDLSAEWINCIYSSEVVKPNTAAIQTDIPINGYTVGGVRPTFPTRGDVWMSVSNNRISGCYIYNGTAWESVNARWYTGTRWIPIYAFDLTTLRDCWDIADMDTTIVMIATESQFWAWLQNAWQKMLDKLDAIIIALGGDPDYSSGSSGNGSGGLWDRIKTAFSDALGSIIESLMTFITDVLQLVLDLVYDLLSFFFDFLSTEVVTGIANLFSAFTDGSLLVFFQQDVTTTDEEGNETTTTIIALPEGVATAFAFFAGVIMILPEELRTLLIFGVGALILIGVLKLARS